MNEILTKMTRVEEDKEPFVKALPQYPYRGTMAANEGLGGGSVRGYPPHRQVQQQAWAYH